MFHRIAFVIVLFLLAFPAGALAFQGYVQPFGEDGEISWGSGEIVVVRQMISADNGTAQEPTPLAVRKAASQARKQMLDMVMGVRIDSRRTISAYLAGDDELAARVRGVVHNSPFQRPAMFDEGGEIRVSESLRGKLAELVFPTTIQFQSGIPPRLSTSMEQSMSFDESAPEQVGTGSGSYSGVIIDARGLKVTPALAPVIYGQDGIGAYGPFVVSRDNAIAHGVTAYATTTDPAVLHNRVGERPLTVKALSTYGSWRTDLIITSPMAALVRAIMRPGDITDNCRVVIVIDAPEPLVEELPEMADEDQPVEDQ